MFRTLLSYEIRSRARADARVLATLAAVVAASLVVIALNIPALSGSVTRICYLLCGGAFIGTYRQDQYLAGMVDYWKTLYGQRGYFMMSLPASGASIFWAKNTRICLESLVGLAFAAGGIVATAAVDAWRQGASLAQYTAGIRGAFDIFPSSMLVVLAIGHVIATLAMIVEACAVMTIGAEGRFSHMGFGAPLIGFVALYVVNQVIGAVGTLVVPLSVDLTTGRLTCEAMWSSFLATMHSNTPPSLIGVGSLVLGPLLAIALGVWASRSIEKHTSLR